MLDAPTLPSKVQGHDIYIDGFQALRRPKVLRDCNITHIVSAVDWKFSKGSDIIKGFQHFHVPLDDVYDSNILSYFPQSNAFIHEAVRHSRREISATDNAHSPDESPEPPTGGVLVHCAMGVSRSATIVLAYLLWLSRHQSQKPPSSPPVETTFTKSPDPNPVMVSIPSTTNQPLSLDDAMSLIRQTRPQINPNSGFIKQLLMYIAMGCPTTQQQLESHKIYRRWMNSREVMDALGENRAPEMEHIQFRDEEEDDEDESSSSPSQNGKNMHNRETDVTNLVSSLDLSDPESDSATEIHNPDITLSSPSPAPPLPSTTTIKCRKCRRLLAKSTFIIPHKPPAHRDPSADSNADPCAHIFLHPLSWMRPTLSQGGLDGRLTCPTPRCGANIGKFAWQGLRCSCGGWVTPGFGLAKGKVDEVQGSQSSVGASNGSKAEGGSSGGTNEGQGLLQHGIRLPPGMKRTGNGNL